MKAFANLGKLLGIKPKAKPVTTSKPAPLAAGKHLHMTPAEPGFENRDQRYRMVNPLTPPFPLPHVSRESLRRIQNPLPVPTVCPYCEGEVALDSNDVIYRGKRYGDWPYVYHCAGDCDAYVGLHPNTDIPLGSLADRETREARKESKALFFEWLRIAGLERQRNKAYPLLADAMGIPIADCHFAMFDVAKCVEAQALLGHFIAERLQSQSKGNRPWNEQDAFDDDIPF